MTSNYVVNKSIRINGTPSQVWDALTNPEKTKQYFFHCEVLSDWKEGATITFKGKMFFIIDIEMTGKILELAPDERLKYTLRNGKDNDDSVDFSIVTDTLTYEDGVTTLTVSDDVGSSEGAEERMEKSEAGWDKVLEGLKDLIDKENANAKKQE